MKSHLPKDNSFRYTALICIVAATLVMGAGWGIRGSFGHCRGAMMPGAMLGLVLAACAGRADWWRRGPIIGLLAGIGWAIGGTSSYGLLIGYTLKEDWWTSVHGYYGLLIVGGLYSGIGCGLLGLSITQSRRFLESALWPLIITYFTWLLLDWTSITEWSLDLVAKDPAQPEVTHWLYDTVWLYALATLPISGALLLVRRWRGPALVTFLMAIGWWLAMLVLIGALGIRINPSRNDSWAGVLGALLGLCCYLIWTRNRATLMLVMYGLVSGSIGFPVGQLLQSMGRLKWGPMGSNSFLAELNHWTLMEQTFGYLMGLGAALGVMRLIRLQLTPPVEDRSQGWMNWFSAWVLLGLLLVFNAGTNLRHWFELELLKPSAMNVPTSTIVFWVAILWLFVMGWILIAQRKKVVDLLPASAKGKIQWLALLMMVAVMSLYVLLPSFGLPTSLMFVSALAISGLCVVHAGQISVSGTLTDPQEPSVGSFEPVESDVWRLGWGGVIVALLVFLLPLLLATLTWSLPR